MQTKAAQLLPTPTITDMEQLHAAFDLMHWPEWTFERAMEFDLRRQLLVFHAAKVANQSPQPIQPKGHS